MSKFQKNQTVTWHWAQGTGSGKVREVHQSRVTRTIKGSQITRNASRDNPAYTIVQNDGDEVLKSESELQSAQ